MIHFFAAADRSLIALEATSPLSPETVDKLRWLFQGAELLPDERQEGAYIGPRKEMVTPWSTNAVEITQNMGIAGISRIESFVLAAPRDSFDPMLQAHYNGLDQSLFRIAKVPEPVQDIKDIGAYNQSEGLALSEDEVEYLTELSRRLGRLLTDSEVFGFSQVNSEHCRHKIFNGRFIIGGEEMPDSLFGWIRRTSREHPNLIVSAYKDNVAFIRGPEAMLFAPRHQDRADWFDPRPIPTVLSLKAETHNFPTTVEPFNGAATGSGGEIRDRMAGGRGSFPLAGTAVYMTSYSRAGEHRGFEGHTQPRNWLYQDPRDILVKASNGASDFGNKFGQPLICGSVLTFEQQLGERLYGYDKVIMLAGGVGYGHAGQSRKGEPAPGDRVIVLGGDNYRIGMGGGAVSSVATGEFGRSIELNAVQRSNPEMQKRVYNAIRAMVESEENPVVSVHDHGAGGHLNSLSELVEATGGCIDLRNLPLGDPTLSAREIIGNESQERMGLVLPASEEELLKRVAERERAPMYDVGEVTGDQRFVVHDSKDGRAPIDLHMADMFGKPPRTELCDEAVTLPLEDLITDPAFIGEYLRDVLQQEAVACKDWLTNKVDRSVTGRVALQQCSGEIQLPVNDLGLMALDYSGALGVATSLGHAPGAALIDPAAGSRLAVSEALTNLVFAPLTHGLKGVSLSANWMWPARQPGENARLYHAVKAISDFAVDLGINIPTGKDSLSMTQRYPDGRQVLSPGTVIVSAMAETGAVNGAVSAAIRRASDAVLIYIPFTRTPLELGGTALAQTLGRSGRKSADVTDADYLVRAFNLTQRLLREGLIMAGHDVSAGGLVTCLAEMLFPMEGMGLTVDTSDMETEDPVRALFAERPAVVVQTREPQRVLDLLEAEDVDGCILARPSESPDIRWTHKTWKGRWEVDALRQLWMRPSYLLDQQQCGTAHARMRMENIPAQPLSFVFPPAFRGRLADHGLTHHRSGRSGVPAAIIREKGVNGDREMAYMMHLAGFDVKDVHMTDLIEGREDLTDVNFIVFVGGFSNSDVLGSARGWAGAFLYNPRARKALEDFYERRDTLSLGVCNGCQLMAALELIPGMDGQLPSLHHNASGKFESAFLSVDIPRNDTVMLGSLSGSRLGIWVAHGEGRFSLPGGLQDHLIPMKYTHAAYPGNPNGSDFQAAAVASADGRHLAMMPHLERAFMPWHWAWYPQDRHADEITPWVEAFVNARKWVEERLPEPLYEQA